MKQWMKKAFAWTLALCMALGLTCGAAAEAVADFEALYPLMDLVCAAAVSTQEDEYAVVIPNSEGELSAEFVDAFFRIGQARSQTLGVTAETLNDTGAQATLLGSIFDAQIPALNAVIAAEETGNYIGFRPVTVNAANNGSVQILGEIYTAPRPLSEMSGSEFADAAWIDRGVFTFRSDSTAMNGFRLLGFSSGTDLNMEEVFMNYNAETVVEYVNTKLGFTLAYPAVFDDELLQEDDTGVGAQLTDGSASFFARRIPNADGSSLEGVVRNIADNLPDAKANINEQNGYGSVTYTTEDGYTVFDVYLVSENYIYQAELRFLSEKSAEYSMYCSYLENSFASEEGAQG